MSPEIALEKAVYCEEMIASAKARHDPGDVLAWERMRERWLEKAGIMAQRIKKSPFIFSQLCRPSVEEP